LADLLVVAGEASGDRAAAGVVTLLGGGRAFGLGGPALAETGVEIVADLRASTALGIGETAARAGAVLRAWRAVDRSVARRRPKAALLVNYTEFNARLARRLRAAGVPVLWYGAPQVWAWRPGRAQTLGPFVDRMALMFPFEERIWRAAGVDARYVGHPAMETRLLARPAARARLGMTPFAEGVAILPGSRPHEVRSLLVPMMDAYERVRADRASVDARVLVASSLDTETRSWTRSICETRRVPWTDVDPREGANALLGAFDVALCASGTVTLEAALARAVPVIAYRAGRATALAARLFLRSPHVGLPNVLLQRRAFTELLQGDARADRIADALADALDRRGPLLGACDEVTAMLGERRTPSAAVAEMLSPWLGGAPVGAA
jgi:lipid-A-disaccharide synthase